MPFTIKKSYVIAVLMLSALVAGYYFVGNQTLNLVHPERTPELLRHYKYQNISTEGYDYYAFACWPNELYRVRFKATSPDGKEVKGAVCGDLVFTGFRVKEY